MLEDPDSPRPAHRSARRRFGATVVLLGAAAALAGTPHAAPGDPPVHTLEGGVPLLFEAHATPELSANQVARDFVAEGGRVFATVVSHFSPTAGGKPQVVRADPTTGAVIWEHIFEDSFSYASTQLPLAALDDGSRVFAWDGFPGTGSAPSASLRALSGADGALLWKVEEPSGFTTAALATEGAWLTAVSFMQQAQFTTFELEGRATADGALLWQDTWAVPTIQSPGTYLATSSMSDDGTRTAVAWTSGTFEATPTPGFGVRVYQTSTGQLLWSDATGPGPAALAPNGKFLATTDAQGALVVLDGATGALLWQATQPGMVRSLAWGSTSSVLFAAVDEDTSNPASPTRVSAFRVVTGAPLWSVLEEPWGPGASQVPVEVEVSPDGSRVALQLNGGDPLLPDAESMAVLFDAGSGARLGALAPGGGAEIQGGGVWGAKHKLAFDTVTDQLLVVGNDPKSPPGTTGRDLWIDRLALATGAQLPRHKIDLLLPTWFDSGAVVFDASGETVVIAGESRGLAAYEVVRGIDVETGALRWERLVATPHPLIAGNWAELARDSQTGTLFSTIGVTPTPTIRALNPLDGAVLWQQPFPNPQSLKAWLTLEAGPDSSLLVAAAQSVPLRVGALDGTTGALLWDVPDPAGITNLGPGGVVVGTSGRVFLAGSFAGATGSSVRVAELDGATGAVQWSWTHGPAQDPSILGAGSDGLALFAGKLFVLERTTNASSGAIEIEVRALDASTGAELYSVPVPGATEGIGIEASLATGLVIAAVTGAGDHRVVGIGAGTGLVAYDEIVSLNSGSYLGRPVLSDDGSTLFLTGSEAPQQGYAYQPWTGAVDCAYGDLLWSATFTEDFSGWELAASPTGNAVGVKSKSPSFNACIVYGTPPLIGAPDELSLSAGGSHVLQLVAGSAHSGDWHFVLGSMTGTTPGTPLDGFTLPLNADAYLALTISAPGSVVQGALGKLSASGSAQATLQLPAGAAPSLAGLELHHAFATIRFTAGVPAVTSVSNAVSVQLLP